jgi:undecaprenyl-diphosphatase
MAATLLSQGSSTSAYWELAVLVAASRVYVRMHHASDAVAGTLLGLAFGQIAKRVLTPSTGESPG